MAGGRLAGDKNAARKGAKALVGKTAAWKSN